MDLASRRCALVIATFLTLPLTACRPSATVERTMPVANLQTFRTIAIRVRNNTFASQGQTVALQNAVLEKVRMACQFDQVELSAGQPADVLLDLNITGSGRGGGGILSNPNVATVDTLLVLSDTQDGQLLGTAKIRGKSGGVVVNNSVPEFEAIDAIAKSIADLMAKSGCKGPRIARAEPPPPPNTGSGSATPPDQGSGGGSATPPPPPSSDKLAQAEAINDQGKEKLYAADLPGALALFQQANTMAPDARFAFNVCIVQMQLERWNEAAASCDQARSLSPPPSLAAKIDNRIAQLKARK